MCIINLKGKRMISAVNSTRFASANNYKKTYTNTNQNTNQNTVGYQQSFGASKLSALTLAALSLGSNLVTPAFAEKGTARAGKAVAGAITEAVEASHITPIPQEGLSLYEIFQIGEREATLADLPTVAELAAKNHLTVTPIPKNELPQGSLSDMIKTLNQPGTETGVTTLPVAHCKRTIYSFVNSLTGKLRPKGMVIQCDNKPFITVRKYDEPGAMKEIVYDKRGDRARRGSNIGGQFVEGI